MRHRLTIGFDVGFNQFHNLSVHDIQFVRRRLGFYTSRLQLKSELPVHDLLPGVELNQFFGYVFVHVRELSIALSTNTV